MPGLISCTEADEDEVPDLISDEFIKGSISMSPLLAIDACFKVKPRTVNKNGLPLDLMHFIRSERLSWHWDDFVMFDSDLKSRALSIGYSPACTLKCCCQCHNRNTVTDFGPNLIHVPVRANETNTDARMRSFPDARMVAYGNGAE
ncbi:hypothetical protein B0H13DRAFT_1916199 [Mycena leptocephala]|nr:hypothetical protein B0H13DRAFT_1916199 [Mycena leptocephala]